MVISTAGAFAGPCFRCSKSLEAGEHFAERNGRRYHGPCEPSPRCPICGAWSATGYGCEMHLASAAALARFSDGVTKSFEGRLTPQLQRLFAPAHVFPTAPEPQEQFTRRVYGH